MFQLLVIFKSCCKRRWPSGPSNLLRHFGQQNRVEEDFEFEDRSLMWIENIMGPVSSPSL